MKILQVSHYYAPHLGGVEKHLRQLNQELLTAGHEVTVLTSQHEANLPTNEVIDGVKVKRLSLQSVKYLGLFKIWWQLLKQINFFRQFDLIQIHDIFIWFLPVRILLPFKPVFMTFHGYQSSPIKTKEKWWVRLAAFLTQGSLSVGDFIPKYFEFYNTQVIYGAVDLERFQHLADKHRKTEESFNALYVGRFDRQVGFDIYLEAVQALQKDQEFKFGLLGGGSQLNLVNLPGKNLGWVKEVAPYYFQTEYVFASGYLSMLEAMAAQKLVFAAHLPGDDLREDYLKRTPFAQWLVIVNNPQQLVKQVKYYQEHPAEAEEKIKAAYDWVQSQTWSKLAETDQQFKFI